MIFIIGLAILGGLVVTVDAVKKKKEDANLHPKESEYMSIRFDEPFEEETDDEEETANQYITENIQFLYLPEGFELTKNEKVGVMSYYKFTDGQEDIWFRIYPRENLLIDTDLEEANIEKIELKDRTIFKRVKQGKTIGYVWNDEDCSYMVSSTIDVKNTLKFVENIKILNNF